MASNGDSEKKRQPTREIPIGDSGPSIRGPKKEEEKTREIPIGDSGPSIRSPEKKEDPEQ